MKVKLIMISTLFLLSISILSCVSSSAVSEVSCDEFISKKNVSKSIDVPAGGTFSITLCSNPTTGFNWSEKANISDTSILQQIEHKFIEPDVKGMPGASGKERWTFKALKSGKAMVKMEYGRPWAGGEKGEWTFSLAVNVK